MLNSEIIKRAAECLQCEAAAIESLIPRLDADFLRAVELIRACKGKIVVTGVGKSGHIGSKIAATLASTGTPAFFLNPLDAYHGDLGMSSRDLKDYEQELLDYQVIAQDEIAVIVNAENPLQDIALDTLRQIYTGEVNVWNELNP